MTAEELLPRVKENLIITFDDDDSLITGYITTAISYAESYQHLEQGYYTVNTMSDTTRQGVIMLASHFYESRDGSSGGFFAGGTAAADQSWKAIHSLLRMDREWKV